MYEAISSTNGKISHLVIAFDGRKESLAFIKDILTNFREDIHILIYLNSTLLRARLKQMLVLIKRKNYTVIPHETKQETSIVDDPLNHSIGSVWIRDAHYVAKQKGHSKLLFKRAMEIPEHLTICGVVEGSIFMTDFPDFGNILIDDSIIYTTIRTTVSIPKRVLSFHETSLEYLLKKLFPNSFSSYSVIELGLKMTTLLSGTLKVAENKKSTTRTDQLKIPSKQNSSGLKFDISSYFKHLDLFLTPMGIKNNKKRLVLVPKLVTPQEKLYGLADKGNLFLDMVRDQLMAHNIEVIRNPIPLLQKENGLIWIGYLNNAIVEVTENSRFVWITGLAIHEEQYRPFLEKIKLENKEIWAHYQFNVTFITGGMSALNNGGNRAGGLRCLTIDIR